MGGGFGGKEMQAEHVAAWAALAAHKFGAPVKPRLDRDDDFIMVTGKRHPFAYECDVGRSLNPAIDIGQIEGGFIQGMGWLTTEELVWDAKGRLATHAPSTYKIPATSDVPEHFNVALWPEANREDNVGGSKAVGEPPFMLAVSVYEALRNAVAAARVDGGAAADERIELRAPATAENVLRALGRVMG